MAYMGAVKSCKAEKRMRRERWEILGAGRNGIRPSLANRLVPDD